MIKIEIVQCDKMHYIKYVLGFLKGTALHVTVHCSCMLLPQNCHCVQVQLTG